MEDNKLYAEGRQAEILTDHPTTFVIGDSEYQITALKPYTSWKIGLLINNIQKAEATLDGMLGALANNIPLLAEVIALAILNDSQKIDIQLEGLKLKLLNVKNYHNWMEILKVIFEKMDLGFFFLITRQIEQLSTMVKKMTKEQHEQLVLQRN